MSRQGPYWIHPDDPELAFPDVSLALREPDGLLAVGGDLSPGRILSAYRRGIFPWFSEDQPILWWSPDPRTVLFPEKLKVSRSLRKTLRRGELQVTMDQSFAEVISACAQPRPGSSGTWITDQMLEAYIQLHHLGHAHSVESWREGRLVGGVYGVAIGRVFFGESMFSRCPDASKVAFAWLVRQLAAWDFGLIDCQVHSAHLASLGAQEIARPVFIQHLQALCGSNTRSGHWSFDNGILQEPW